jgi:hypothetical protein
MQQRRDKLHLQLHEDMLSDKKLKEVAHRFQWLTEASIRDGHGRRPAVRHPIHVTCEPA